MRAATKTTETQPNQDYKACAVFMSCLFVRLRALHSCLREHNLFLLSHHLLTSSSFFKSTSLNSPDPQFPRPPTQPHNPQSSLLVEMKTSALFLYLHLCESRSLSSDGQRGRSTGRTPALQMHCPLAPLAPQGPARSSGKSPWSPRRARVRKATTSEPPESLLRQGLPYLTACPLCAHSTHACKLLFS